MYWKDTRYNLLLSCMYQPVHTWVICEPLIQEIIQHYHIRKWNIW